MNENTKNLKTIANYCKTHRQIDFRTTDTTCLFNCPIKRNCIESVKRSRYNDPRFVSKSVLKIERALAKEKEEMGIDPFVEVE